MDVHYCAFSTKQGSCTYELIVIVTSCTRLVKTKARPNFRMEKGSEEKALPLSKELLAIDDYWERKSPFSLGVWPLVGRAYLSGWPYTQNIQLTYID